MESNLYDIWLSSGYWKFLIPFDIFKTLKLSEIIKYKIVKLNLSIKQ